MATSSHNARVDKSVCANRTHHQANQEPAAVYCCACDVYLCDECTDRQHPQDDPARSTHLRLRLKPTNAQKKLQQQQEKQQSPPTSPGAIPPQLSGEFTKEAFEKPADDESKNPEAQHIGTGISQGAYAFGKGVLDGFTGIVMEPIQGGKENGAVGVIKGAATGIGNAAVKPVRGTGTLLARTAEGLRNTPTAIFSDDGTEVKQHTEMKHVGQGLFEGTKSFGMGIFDGITGVVTEPIRGAEKDGVGGFFKGVGRGLVGVVCKPVAGAIDLVAKPIEGIANTPGTIAEKIDERSKKKKENEAEKETESNN